MFVEWIELVFYTLMHLVVHIIHNKLGFIEQYGIHGSLENSTWSNTLVIVWHWNVLLHLQWAVSQSVCCIVKIQGPNALLSVAQWIKQMVFLF